MITPQTPVELWREADRLMLWRGPLVEYFIKFGISEPRAVLAVVRDLMNPDTGHAIFTLRLAVSPATEIREITGRRGVTSAPRFRRYEE